MSLLLGVGDVKKVGREVVMYNSVDDGKNNVNRKE